MILSQRKLGHPLPSILYTQLLGLTLGIDRKALGMEMSEIPITGIEGLLAKETKSVEQPGSTEEIESNEE